MMKIDFNTVGGICNSLNALEGRYRFSEPDRGTSSILHDAQELIWMLWVSYIENKGSPISEEMKEVLKNAEN